MLKWWKNKTGRTIKKGEIIMENNNHNFVKGDWVKCREGGTLSFDESDIKSEFDWYSDTPHKVVNLIDHRIQVQCIKSGAIVVIDYWDLEHAFKNGDEVEVSDKNNKWLKGEFIGLHPKRGDYRYIVFLNDLSCTPLVSCWKYIRPIQPKPTTIEWMGQELSIESAKAMVEGINKKLEEI